MPYTNHVSTVFVNLRQKDSLNEKQAVTALDYRRCPPGIARNKLTNAGPVIDD